MGGLRLAYGFADSRGTVKRLLAIALVAGCAVDGPADISLVEQPVGVCAAIGYAGAVIDDGDPCFEAGGPVASLRNISEAGKDGDLVWTHTTDDVDEGNFAQWHFDFEQAGRYRLEVFTDAAYAESKQAKYVVQASGASVEKVIDQTAASDWQSLGELDFARGGDQGLRLSDNTGEPLAGNVQLVFDAVRLFRIEPENGSGPDEEPPSDGGCAVGGQLGVALIALLAGLWRRRGG